MDLLLTDSDLDITDGELSFIRGALAVAQHVTMRLRTWLGETAYDETAGIPYLQVIFARKNPNLNAVQFILEDNIRRTPGVESVALTLELDSVTRTLTVSGSITAFDEEVDFSEIISP